MIKIQEEKIDHETLVNEVKNDRAGAIVTFYGTVRSRNYRIESIPTILFFKNGKAVDMSIGVVPKEVLAQKIKSLA